MRYRFLRFPEGKPKAVTLSYDDGIRADKRFSDIITKYGMKCTFNINSEAMNSGNPNKLTADELREYVLDRGHEIAIHGENHIAPGIASPAVAIADMLNCRKTLEDTFGMIIRGMAYPDSGITIMHNGNTYEDIRRYLTDIGVAYSRTLAADNNSFHLPTDFMAWVPTAHHTNPKLDEWTDEFVAFDDSKLYLTRRYPRLFYLWGHSYEFDNNDDWYVIERFCEKISGKSDTWYATNIEICEYVNAYNSLVTSVDGTRIYNPTLKQIWFMADGKDYTVLPGETITL